MRVLKFGGSSFTVVFSAFGGVTDSLIAMSKAAENADDSYEKLFKAFSKRHQDAAKALLKGKLLKEVQNDLKENHAVLKSLLKGINLVREATPRTMDYVQSFGERNSAYIISKAMLQRGIKAAYLDARDIIKTDKNFGTAKVDPTLTYKNIRNYYKKNTDIQVVTGFIASAKGGLTSTLGRGGSDYTASLLAAGLGAKHVEIWTDVDGVLTADPRRVSKAFTIPTMTYAEAMEMSHFGAKVIYPPTLQPALNKRIPIFIKNTFNPTFRGTYISEKQDPKGNAVKGISSISNVALLTLQGSGMVGVPGIAGRLFSSLAQAKINIILITQGSSEHSISFAIQPKFAIKAKKAVEEEFEYEISKKIIIPVKIEDNLSVVAIIGENMRYRPGISGRLFNALGNNGINAIAIAQGSSELNVSVVINKDDEHKALNALHEAFFLSDTKVLHLFMVGVGLIGSTFLKQLKEQTAFLKEKQALEIKVVGLANSKKMLFNKKGTNLKNWKEKLLASDEKMSFKDFIQKMKELNLPNSIFVDNTANEEISTHYEEILDSSISISTPNKIATSSSYLQYQNLKAAAQNRGVYFMYETNVGAGLPVISTLNDLMNSGDEILKIEGVLSGSLSYIFNNYKEGVAFSDIVKKAGDLGYTEPDPRIDLNGIDVRRKIIILARETGLPLEAKHVKIKNILPKACQDAKTVPQFFKELKKADTSFEKLRIKAEKEGKALRMIASLENGKASIGLQAVDNNHPFYSLSGSDNMIVFTTKRYNERPLVVRGPGAGAEVTAAGVFAEIISIGNLISK